MGRINENSLSDTHQDEFQEFDSNLGRHEYAEDVQDNGDDSTITKYSSSKSSLSSDGQTSQVLNIEANVRFEVNNEATLVVEGLPNEINLKKIEIVQSNEVRSYNLSPEAAGANGRKGFDKAFQVFGKFLLLKKNKELFVDWIQETTKANIKQAGDCYQCLYVWCQEFL